MLTELGRLTRDLAAAASRRAQLIAVRGHGGTVLVAADDPEAKQAVLALVEAAGLRGIDAVRCAVLASWRPWASYT